MFSYYPNVKRPRNGGIKRRWEDKIADDLNKCQIHNWRKDTLVREKWRELINKPVQTRPIHSNIKNIVQEYKNMAVKRRIGIQQIKVTEALQRNQDNTYTCPKCTRFFKPQGITNHVRACATDWCIQNKIQMYQRKDKASKTVGANTSCNMMGETETSPLRFGGCIRTTGASIGSQRRTNWKPTKRTFTSFFVYFFSLVYIYSLFCNMFIVPFFDPHPTPKGKGNKSIYLSLREHS